MINILDSPQYLKAKRPNNLITWINLNLQKLSNNYMSKSKTYKSVLLWAVFFIFLQIVKETYVHDDIYTNLFQTN